jgi:hypothetical protein
MKAMKLKVQRRDERIKVLEKKIEELESGEKLFTGCLWMKK